MNLCYHLQGLGSNLLELSLEAVFWLVLGLVIGGLIKALVSISFLQKHLDDNGIVSITKAALIGVLLLYSSTLYPVQLRILG